jgi:hypothetical protein
VQASSGWTRRDFGALALRQTAPRRFYSATAMSNEDIKMGDSATAAPAVKLDKGKGRDALSTLALDVSLVSHV